MITFNQLIMRKLNSIEEEIMQIFWKLGKAFPKEVREEFKRKMPYNTFLSIIRKLETDKFLDYRKIGRSHQYYPLIDKKQYSKSLFRNLFTNFFSGSKEQMLSFFIEEENVDPNEIKELLKKFKSK